MFGIDPKKIFLQTLSYIIAFLFAIKVIALAFTYLIKWIRPYLINRNVVYNKQKPKYTSLFGSWSENKNKRSVCNECEGEITDNNEYISIIGNLKDVIDITDNHSKALLDSSSLMKINMSDSEFENALRLVQFLRKINKRLCSSEAQTNITIDPGVKVDYSCSALDLSALIPGRIIKSSESSDSFLSASSENSSTDVKTELEKIINELESDDGGQKQKADEDVTLQKLQRYLKTSLAKADLTNSFKRHGSQVSQDNKLLELAITEFEKELKPIKDQIKVLKECISGFDVNCNTQNSIPSDFTSSVTGSGMISECVSGTLSTTCSTDLQSYFSSYHIVSASSFGSLDTNYRFKNIKKLDKIISSDPFKNRHKTNPSNKNSLIINKEMPRTRELFKSKDRYKLNKRSPMAEMYVKLSQCNSQASCLIKTENEKQPSNDSTVTYRIDLNVNLAGVPASNNQKQKLVKEREMQPMTSDPEEIFGKPSNSHISLRPGVK